MTKHHIYDTVGELMEFLRQLPADLPVASTYDGRGRVAAIPSYEDDGVALVSIFPVTDAYLDGNGLDRDNPMLGVRR